MDITDVYTVEVSFSFQTQETNIEKINMIVTNAIAEIEENENILEVIMEGITIDAIPE